VRAVQSEKESLGNTIDQLNRRHEFELEGLNARLKSIAEGSSELQTVDMVARVNRDYSELMSKYRQTQAALRNEAAEHLGTKKRIAEMEGVVRNIKSRSVEVETDYQSLIQTLQRLFQCSSEISEVIVAVSKAARENNELGELRRRMAQNDKETAAAKLRPAQLQYELNRTQSWLEQEQKKTQILEMRVASVRSDAFGESISQFLEVVIRESDDEKIKRVASCLITRADPASWGKFAHVLVGGPKASLRIAQRTMREMSQKVAATVERCENLIAKARFGIARSAHRKNGASEGRSRIPLAVLGNARTPLPKRIPFDVPRRMMPAGVEPPSTISVY
jgi:hypothetical protein